MNCTCDGWAEGLPQIAAQAAFCSIQSAGPEYTAAKFKFCPWCGRPLEDNAEVDKALDLETDGLLLEWARESATDFITLDELGLVVDNLLNREEESEDAILAASGVLQRLVDRVLQDPSSPDWERELEEIEKESK